MASATNPVMGQNEALRQRLLGRFAPNYVGRRYVKLERLFNDHEAYQRALNKAKVKRAVEEFHPLAVSILLVNIRSDGTLWLMNGQHTAAILAAWYRENFPDVDPREYEAEAEVFQGLSLEDEKLAWKAKNTNSTQARYIETLRARLNDPVIVDMARACKAAGFELQVPPTGNRSPYTIQAVYSVEEVYKRGRTNGYPDGGFGLVRDTLTLVREAWGDDNEMVKGKCLIGIAIFLSACRTHSSYTFGKAVNRFRGKSTKVLNYVQAMSGVSTGGVSGTYAAALLKLFNRNLSDEYAIPEDVFRIGRRTNKAA